ncbi:MAG TPA: single-stranded-DNA-specific exonuclease RecJ [Anaerolineaceae bacterium]|nr:single-stranded-DNA-specific exonuclease RecJ [Anaerolineaceae bacterium]
MSAATIWIEPAPVEVPAELAEFVGGHALISEALVRRGIKSIEAARRFLFAEHYPVTDPLELPDLGNAAERMMQALKNGERIGVWGDFDVDGQTATTLLVAGLRALGGSVIHHIPVRGRETHGIQLAALKEFLAQGVEVILTCDTGVTAHESIDYAQSMSVDVVVTDHHTLAETLPAARAVVNPQRLPEGHSLRTLCGAGVAYQLLMEICQRAGRPEVAADQLDLAALGTVADLAILTGDSRWIVQKGLERLREHPRPAIQAMLELAGAQAEQLNEQHISFMLAPRLNALGRLDDANPIVDFLTASEIAAARQMAVHLEGLNAQRRLLCDQVFRAAQAQIAQNPAVLDEAVLILAHPEWPASVVGIVASRLVELYQLPTLLLHAPPGEAARGSARSVEGINITAAIAANQHLLLGFGGHPMAAGLSLAEEKLPEFRRALARTVRQMRAGERPAAEMAIDAFLPLTDLSLELSEDIARLAPFGPGNPPLTLATRNLMLRSWSFIGRTQEHLQLLVEDEAGNTRKVLWWQGAGSPLPEGRFDLAYTLQASSFRGQAALQVEWLHARQIEGPGIGITAAPKPLEIVDLRTTENPADQLSQLDPDNAGMLWVEGADKAHLPGADRYHLTPAETLVVWNLPPGPLELQIAVQTVNPQRVIFVGITPPDGQINDFLKRLMGLVQYAIRQRQGWAGWSELAAAMAQREVTVQAGIKWLASQGKIQIVATQLGRIQIEAGGAPALPGLQASADRDLKALLNETAAFRAYLRRASLEGLLNK